ncbi:DUF2256 domain-containing protein [Phycisphaera mikurensis]|uniref:DUF2256 domain-containing protein n=1 Tax=Phycisphaera mikurensis (strain NBRC 102666 / KCTC 22515 / FYK2301M01) TaxID=1142394 RepID=I0IB80_PHYMF|nr:DUF2256 domain-containing protein [Phycisphaera mikurensis]MBB6443016.1 hypothetical protein [Phycisphaera mikurensis]BAM02518.1 hypothetical protein PSMK_03590 [Phycisphaera mikurensis NBRC 102666]
MRRGNDRQAKLPVKDCAVCKRPIVWRKKWERDWESVKFCSERCRRAAASSGQSKPRRG